MQRHVQPWVEQLWEHMQPFFHALVNRMMMLSQLAVIAWINLQLQAGAALITPLFVATPWSVFAYFMVFLLSIAALKALLDIRPSWRTSAQDGVLGAIGCDPSRLQIKQENPSWVGWISYMLFAVLTAMLSLACGLWSLASLPIAVAVFFQNSIPVGLHVWWTSAAWALWTFLQNNAMVYTFLCVFGRAVHRIFAAVAYSVYAVLRFCRVLSISSWNRVQAYWADESLLLTMPAPPAATHGAQAPVSDQEYLAYAAVLGGNTLYLEKLLEKIDVSKVRWQLPVNDRLESMWTWCLRHHQFDIVKLLLERCLASEAETAEQCLGKAEDAYGFTPIHWLKLMASEVYRPFIQRHWAGWHGQAVREVACTSQELRRLLKT